MKDLTEKTYSVHALAEAMGGRFVGDGSLCVKRVVHPANDSVGPDDLILAMDKALLPLVEKSAGQVAMIAEGVEPPASLKAAIIVGRPRLALAKLTNLFEKKTDVPVGVHPMAVVEEGAQLGKDVAVGPFCFISAGAKIGAGCIIHPQVYIGPDVEIGEGSLLYAGVRVGARVKIGARAIVHFNATIGADGFSFVTPDVGSVEAAKSTGEVGAQTNTQLVRIASLGAVELGDDVEIGANTSIDRGTIVSTRIGNGTKIDNQVQIGHNVVVGANCMLCGRVGIAGSCVIEDRVVLGGAVGIADHVTIGHDSVVMAMSGVAGNIPPKSIYGGRPAKPRSRMIEDIRNAARIRPLLAKVKALAERVAALEEEKKN